ncbi:MAG TPA: AAA family ATPase [Gammaproteobacteria bacterium]|nr:AAA family ATPase [Gammaproteobacteria bacterium]
MDNIKHAISALNFLDPGCSYEEWIQIGMSAKVAGLSFKDFHAWCINGSSYKDEKDCLTAWNSFKKAGGITAATLFYLARNKGWRNPEETKNCSITFKDNNKIKKQNNHNAFNKNLNVFDVWERCLPAEATNEYIIRKQGNSSGLRYYPSTEQPLLINGVNIADYLAVPCWENDEIQTIQFISPKKGALKLNLNGASFNNGYFVVGIINNIIYICEGIGHAWSMHEASGAAAIVCFSFSRMMKISKVIRQKYPQACIVVVSDRGKEKKTAEIAAAVSGQWLQLPQGKPENYDVNDFAIEHGTDALCDLIANPSLGTSLNIVFASELVDSFTPPDEIVEGVLINGEGSILYGESNSGKTFFVIDLACAIALGINWMNRKTEPGLVVYLAVESPASVMRRLQAYQKYHKVTINNFIIVKNPINLFDSDADTNAIIKLISALEIQYKTKVHLIIGDTLARLSAGANENAGQDMGLVIRHFDRIRNECNVHFMMIHHSGKNAAAGARGWSGVRAAVDTEIEVTDSPIGRCAEITKQRDLDTKGTRIGFKLEPVELGYTKWRSIAKSCVVLSADAPEKSTNKRFSEIAGAVIEYLSTNKCGIKKSELVKHFTDRYTSGAIYRELKKLAVAGQISDSLGYIRILVPIGAN